LGRSRTTKSRKQQGEKAKKAEADEVPSLEEFLLRRDYEGALTLLDFLKKSKQMSPQASSARSAPLLSTAGRDALWAPGGPPRPKMTSKPNAPEPTPRSISGR